MEQKNASWPRELINEDRNNNFVIWTCIFFLGIIFIVGPEIKSETAATIYLFFLGISVIGGALCIMWYSDFDKKYKYYVYTGDILESIHPALNAGDHQFKVLEVKPDSVVLMSLASKLDFEISYIVLSRDFKPHQQ